MATRKRRSTMAETDEIKTAQRLIMQGQNHGTFALLVGAGSFRFMWRLGLFHSFEMVDGDPTTLSYLGTIRIMNHSRLAPDEDYYNVAPGGKLVGSDGKLYEPEEVLSLDAAPSGWSVDNGFVVGFGNLAELWLEQRGYGDDSSGG